MKRIYLIDCPGVVPPSPNDSDTDILLRGVVRVENVQNPEQYIPAVLGKCKSHHIQRTYDLKDWDGDAHVFLEMLARKGGKLLKGGEADQGSVAKMVINDFLRGKIPWYTPPPQAEGPKGDIEAGIEGRAGRLGEMGRKRKRDQAQNIETNDGTNGPPNGPSNGPSNDLDDFNDGMTNLANPKSKDDEVKENGDAILNEDESFECFEDESEGASEATEADSSDGVRIHAPESGLEPSSEDDLEEHDEDGLVGRATKRKKA